MCNSNTTLEISRSQAESKQTKLRNELIIKQHKKVFFEQKKGHSATMFKK